MDVDPEDAVFKHISSPIEASGQEASGQEEKHIVVGIKLPPCLYPTHDGARRHTGQGLISPESYTAPTGTQFFSAKKVSTVAQGDIVSSTPSPCPVDDTDQNQEVAVSTECLNEANDWISEILKVGCRPVILVILVTNDDPSAQGPPFDVEATHEVYKSALETFGATVIPVKNRSKEFLLAIVEALKDRGTLSCELLWFIFSGHGRESSFSIKQQCMEFDKAISAVSKISAPCFFFIFECCQLEGKGVQAVKFQSQHMVLYSAPPDGVSFHYDGVGLMASTLAEMLQKDYPKSLNDLQLELRQSLLKKAVAASNIPPQEIAPVQTTNMYQDINLYKKIQEATRPRIAVTLTNGNREANFAVTHPRRIMHNSSGKFELVGYKFVSETETKGMCLGTVASNFEVNLPQSTLPLPLQADEMSGKLIVAAKYGDGRLVFSEPCEVSLPVYEKSTLGFEWGEDDGKGIARFTLDNGVQVSTDDHRFRTEWFQIGYFDSSNEWVELYHREGRDLSGTYPVTFPRSRVSLPHALRAAVKYENCCELVYSEPQEIHQRASRNKLYHQLRTYWKHILTIALLIVFLLLPVIAGSCIATTQLSLNNQLIAIGQTISLQPTWYSYWCEGLRVTENINGYSDNDDGLNVSAYLVDNSAIEKENITVESDRYPGMNRILYDKQRYLVPQNYYSDPLYLLKGSTIVLQTRIHLPEEAANPLSSAIVHFFDSEEVAVKYKNGEISAKKQVHYLNVTGCVHNVCTQSFTIDENSFYFFVLSSYSTSKFNITTNFTFHVIRFMHPFSHSGALNVANISINSSGFIPFNSNKQVLLYAHKPDSIITPGPLGHLNVTCVQKQWLHAVVVTSSFVPLGLFLCCVLVISVKCFTRHKKLKRRNNLNVTTPLLSHDNSTVNN